jgi:hypothetical protein
MTRSRFTPAALAGFIGLAAFCPAAAHAETTWIGNVFVTAVPAPDKCINSSGNPVAEVGDYYRGLFRPAGTALGNGADSYFALVGQRSSFTITVPNNSFQAGINYGSSYVSASINFGSNTAGITRWTQVPATPAPGTANVNLTATLANFWNVRGCTVTLQGALALAS